MNFYIHVLRLDERRPHIPSLYDRVRVRFLQTPHGSVRLRKLDVSKDICPRIVKRSLDTRSRRWGPRNVLSRRSNHFKECWYFDIAEASSHFSRTIETLLIRFSFNQKPAVLTAIYPSLFDNQTNNWHSSDALPE